MSEQTTGKLSYGELKEYRRKYRGYCSTTQRSDFGETLRGLLSHIDYQDAKIERLKQRLLTAAGDDLCRLTQEEIKDLTGGKVPIPPKGEFLASCERFHAQIAGENGVNQNCLTLAQLVAENERLTKELHDYKTAATEEAAAHDEARKQLDNRWCPDKCPITQLDFFMWIEDEHGNRVPTYGGPYDSYTIPTMGGEPSQKWHERELIRHRYDHDAGGWTDVEVLPFRIILEDVLVDLKEKAEQLAAATAKLDSLKVDPAKRKELIADCHGRFQSGFPEGFRFVWLAQSEQFRAGFAAAIDHAFAAGRASAPEVAELQRQLDEAKNSAQIAADAASRLAEQSLEFKRGRDQARQRLAELTKPADEEELAKIGAEAHHRYLIEKCGHDPKLMFNWEKWPEASRSANIAATTAVAARVRAPLLQQIAELTAKLQAAEKRARWNRNEVDAMLEHFLRRTKNRNEWKAVALQLEADHDRLAAELATEKQNHQATAELLGVVSRDGSCKEAELAEAKQAIATLTDERDRTRDMSRQVEAGVAAVQQALAETRAELEQGKIAIQVAFDFMAERWRQERPSHSSKVSELCDTPAYRAIIAMGKPAIPCIITSLRTQYDHWFLALRTISGENPVKDERRGRLSAMSADWIEWWEKQSHAPLTAAEFAELSKVLDAEAGGHSVDAVEKVEPPASDQIQFIVEGYWPHADGSQRWMKANRPFGSYAAAEEWAQNALRAGNWRITPESDRESPASEQAKLAPSVVVVRGKEYRWKFNGSTAYIELPFAMTPGEVEELHASWQVVKASNSEPPASEAGVFVCPTCGSGPKFWVTVSSTDDSTGDLRCPECNWTGTWAEVELAKGEHDRWSAGYYNGLPLGNLMTFRAGDKTFQERIVDWFGSNKRTDEQHKYYHGVFPLGMVGGWIDRASLAERQLAAERQACEAADRQATEKILELERRCNAEHHKCEAAEQRAEQSEKDRDSWKRSFESQNGEIRRLSDAMADNEDAIERLREIGKVIGCDHVGGPDERRQIVNCVEQTVQELEQRAEANGKTIGEESGESCSQCGRANTWHPDCPTCEKIMRLEQRAERLQSRCNEHVAEIEQLIQRVKELGAQLDRENDILRAKNFWRWQGDGNDYPESLTCQVVMTAEQLRGLLQRAEQAEAAAGVMMNALFSVGVFLSDLSSPLRKTGIDIELTNRVHDEVDKALDTDAGRAAANELRALRAFAENIRKIEAHYYNGKFVKLDSDISSAVHELDKAIAEQADAGKETER